MLGAIGNSLMLGYNADWNHVESAPEVAWATGNASWSLQARLHAAAVENVAAPGAGSQDFAAQVAKLQRATLVVVLLPDPALCGPPDPSRDTATYEKEVREGTQALVARGMRPLLVTSPDIVSVAEAARGKPPANDFVLFYATAQSCAAQPDIREKQDAMNAAILRVADEVGALSDHGAVHRIRWRPEMVSDVDGLHPSPAGLRAIADAVWDAAGLPAR